MVVDDEVEVSKTSDGRREERGSLPIGGGVFIQLNILPYSNSTPVNI